MARRPEKLIKAFLDSPVSCCGKWTAKERIHRQRCIRLLLSLAQTGNVDWGRQKAESIAAGLGNEIFRSELELFSEYLEQEGLNPNTICGYRRIATYFLLYCQKNGYGKLFDIRPDDVSRFIVSLYKAGSSLSGLRLFLSRDAHTAQFQMELPVHLLREVKIIEIYDDELTAISDIVNTPLHFFFTKSFKLPVVVTHSTVFA